MKVVLFCGGQGLRLRDDSEQVPKPMVTVGYRPILWHVMRYHAHFGHKEFILCLGYKADVIKDHFLHYEETLSNNFVLSGGNGAVELLKRDIAYRRITFVDTGLDASVGQRLSESIKARPFDLILAPHLDDAHQDHRLVAETVWQTFRDHLIAAYEIPKYDGDLGRPNLFVDVDEATLQRKIDLLQAHFPSQRDRTWWGADTLRAIARLRGIEAATRYAEAFYSRKVVL